MGGGFGVVEGGGVGKGLSRGPVGVREEFRQGGRGEQEVEQDEVPPASSIVA